MSDTVQRAIRDIEIIRRAIEQAERGTATRTSQEPWELRTQVGCISLGLVFLVYERLAAQSQVLLASSTDPNIRYFGVFSAAVLLLMLAGVCHVLVRLAARQSNSSIEPFLERHFLYLRNCSFFFDLAIKYFIFAFLICAREPQYVPPLFSLFIADYVFQGRLFVFSLRLGVLLGAFCCSVAIAQALLENSDLAWPLLLFIFCAASSAVYLRHFTTTEQA